jgi:NADH-quinone oxidoreductase subunit J
VPVLGTGNHVFESHLSDDMSVYIDFFFTTLAILYSLCIIFSKNPVHSVLYLILVFLNISFLFLKYSLEFLGIFLIIIYVGAISILFLFVIMMLKLKQTVKISNLHSILIIIFFFVQLIIILPFTIIEDSSLLINWVMVLDNFTNITIFGNLLYTYYFIFIIIVGIILLLALISSVILTMPLTTTKNTQKIYKQLSRNSNIIFFKNIKS